MSRDTTSTHSPLLVLGGEIPRAELVQALAAASPLVVTADAGALLLDAIGISPDVIIGDFDSVGDREAEFRSRGIELVRITAQDDNDLEKSLCWIRDAGYDGVTVIGFGGAMIDHTLNNFSVLARWGSRLRISLVDDLSIGYMVTERITLATGIDERISLIPLPQARLRTSGLVWELDDEVLGFGVREGASNRSHAPGVHIDVSEGVILVVRYPSNGATLPARVRFS